MKIKTLFVFIFLFYSLNLFSTQVMKIVYFESFPPYSWKNEKGEMEGIFIDIANAVLGKEMGITLIHEGYPWARAQNLVKNGEADSFISVPTDIRKEYTISSTEPFLISPISIFINKYSQKYESIKKIKSVKDLKTFDILDYLGNGWGDEKLKNYKRIKTVDLKSAFFMLENGRGDLIATDNLVAKYVLSSMKTTTNNGIVELPIILDSVAMSLCISKKSHFKYIIPNFDKKIVEFRKKGEIELILKKYSK